MIGGCGNALLENLIVDVERATNNILIINTDGNGTTDPSGEVIVKSGEVVSISATPNTGYVFTSWTGTGITFANRYAADTTVSLAGKTATITANFADENAVFDLTVQSAGNGVTDPSGTIPTLPGVPVIISATPDFSYEFLNWTGPLSAVFGDDISENTTVTITEDSIVQAHFSLLQYWLTVTDDGNGTTDPDTPQLVTHGIPRSIEATPATDYIFKNWSVESGTADIDDPSSASTNATLTSGDAEVKANFDTFKLFYSAWSSPAIWRCYSDWTNHQTIYSNNSYIQGIALDKTNKYVYFTDAHTLNRNIQRCDFDGGTPIDIVTGLSYPYGIALDTANDVLYWSDYGTRQVKSVTLNPTGTPTVIAEYPTVWQLTNPHGMAFHNNKIFWVERNSKLIFEYDVGTQVLSSWSIEAMSQPTDIAISPSQGTSGYLYCTDLGNHYISVFDIASRAYITSFAGPWYMPKGIAIDEPNDVMYITSPYDGEVYEASIYDGSIISVFPQSGKQIKAIAVVPD